MAARGTRGRRNYSSTNLKTKKKTKIVEKSRSKAAKIHYIAHTNNTTMNNNNN
jgi:hypothetical protein